MNSFSARLFVRRASKKKEMPGGGSMAFTRRAFFGTSAALGISLGVKPAFAQAADTLRLALAARGNRTLDPANSIQGADNWAIIHIHDTLVYSPNGRFAQNNSEFVPMLAESFTMSPDARTWTFELRKGVQFHKGYGECTADDVVFSLNRAKDPNQAGGKKVLYENIANVRADGKYTAIVTLTQPDPLFLSGTVQDYSCSILSRKAVQERGANIQRDPIGTGAYQFVSLDPDPSKGVTMTANPGYFNGPPKTKNLQILYILDTTARTLALMSGNVHMIEGVRAPGWVPSIRQRKPGLHFDVAAPGSLFTMSFNLTRKPLDDLRVRQAFAYAIDRDAIAQSMAPLSRRTYGLNPPGFPGGLNAGDVPEALRYKFDPKKAKALLAEAGVPNGFKIDAFTSQREDYNAVMLIVQEQMRAVGINLNLQVIDHTTFHANDEKDLNALPQNSSAYPPVPTQPLIDNLSKSAMVQGDGNGGNNFSHYGAVIPGIDDLLAQANAEPDFDKRIAILQQAEKKVMTDLPIIPIDTNGYLIVRDPKVDLGYDVQSGYAYWRLDHAVINA
jgi:peptide/nickel transport system substrate-binding protein